MDRRHLASLCLLHLFLSAFALAHKPSDSYLRIFGGGERLSAEWDIALKDLEYVVGLDRNQNGEITWGEVKSRRQAIAAHALSRLKIHTGGHACEIAIANLKINRHSDGAYAMLDLDIGCRGDETAIQLQYDLLFEADPTHRGLVLYENDGSTSTHIMTPTDSTVTLQAGHSSSVRTLLAYVRVGIWHIWIGLDHILFLVSLLIPAVWALTTDGWRPVGEFRPACTTALKIVSVFTIAHSITLWLAVMELVTMPGWMIESIIAFSIIVTASNNLYPVMRLSSWSFAFAFGLIHGFGFANVLLDLGLSNYALGLSLLGFNVGVELGQIAIVLIFLPIAYVLRESAFYRWVVFRGGSLLIAMIAAIWMYERIANVEILGF